MNFKGYEVKVILAAKDFVKHFGDKEKDGWEDALKKSFDHLIFECDYMPRIGDWVSCEGHYDGMHVSEIAFCPQIEDEQATILIFVTEEMPTKQL